ncbi:helix-turn-helix domain-containing protein, partial [Comamonas sp. B-9]
GATPPVPAQSQAAEPAPAYVRPSAPLAPLQPQAAAMAPSSLQRFAPPQDLPADLQAWLDGIERDILVRALQEFGFNRTAAANRLGISLRQIRYRMERLQIHDPSDGMQP